MSEPQPIPRLLTFYHNQETSSKKNRNRNQKVHDQNF